MKKKSIFDVINDNNIVIHIDNILAFVLDLYEKLDSQDKVLRSYYGRAVTLYSTALCEICLSYFIAQRFPRLKSLSFEQLTSICFDLKLYDKQIFDLLTQMRKVRNMVHIGRMTKTKEFYSKKSAEKSVMVMLDIFEIVGEKLD